MAKDEKGGKIRFILFEMEGSNDTLQESLRTVTNALTRGASTPVRTVVARPAPAALGDGNGHVEPAYEVIEEIDEAANGAEAPVVSARKKRARKVVTPAVLTDVDLTSGPMSFEQYCELKGPEDQFDKYLVVGAWFKEYRDTNVITPSHIYTCFKEMKWTVPPDVGQPFRDIKKHKGYFSNGPNRNEWEINHLGLNAVNKMGAEGA